MGATRACLATVHDQRALQGLLDKPILQEALITRAAEDGKDTVQPLLEELRSATRGWFQCDLDAKIEKPKAADDDTLAIKDGDADSSKPTRSGILGRSRSR